MLSLLCLARVAHRLKNSLFHTTRAPPPMAKRPQATWLKRDPSFGGTDG